MRECDPLTLKALPQIPSRSPLLYLSSTLALLFPHPFFLLLRLNQAFVSASLPDRRDSGIARLLNHSICPSAGWHPVAAADRHWTKLFFFFLIPVSTWKLSQYSAEYIKLWGIPKVLLQSFTAVDSGLCGAIKLHMWPNYYWFKKGCKSLIICSISFNYNYKWLTKWYLSFYFSYSNMFHHPAGCPFTWTLYSIFISFSHWAPTSGDVGD